MPHVPDKPDNGHIYILFCNYYIIKYVLVFVDASDIDMSPCITVLKLGLHFGE